MKKNIVNIYFMSKSVYDTLRIYRIILKLDDKEYNQTTFDIVTDEELIKNEVLQGDVVTYCSSFDTKSLNGIVKSYVISDEGYINALMKVIKKHNPDATLTDITESVFTCTYSFDDYLNRVDRKNRWDYFEFYVKCEKLKIGKLTIDIVLDKINATGIDSLTHYEKLFLDNQNPTDAQLDSAWVDQMNQLIFNYIAGNTCHVLSSYDDVDTMIMNIQTFNISEQAIDNTIYFLDNLPSFILRFVAIEDVTSTNNNSVCIYWQNYLGEYVQIEIDDSTITTMSDIADNYKYDVFEITATNFPPQAVLDCFNKLFKLS